MNELKVLLVEDSEPDAVLILRELHKGGYSLIHKRIETGEEMREALASETWDIVLCDHALPEFNSAVALGLLRAKDPDLPFIIVSGQIGEDVAVKAMKEGAHDYIMKGNLKRLVPAIQRELRDAQERREHKRAEEELRKREEELRVAKQIELMKDEFVGMVSHELKNPLTVITGALRVVLNQQVSRKEATELIQDALASADSLSIIIDNLLELSRSQKHSMTLMLEPYDVRKIAHIVVGKLEKKSALHKLTNDIFPDLPPIPVDPVRVERILYNLVDNAIKYSPKGGEVRISISRKENCFIVAVTDQGIGISSKDQQRLFQDFERLENWGSREIDGVGLGLKVCQVLVEAHGGRIWVESEVGKGSTFFFTLPFSHLPGQP